MYRQRTALVGMSVAMIALLATATSPALAQRDAGAKMRGQIGTGYWANQRTSRSLNHARDYSRDLYQYSRDAQMVDPEIAKSESEQLGRNIDFAKKQLASVQKEFSNDKAILASLKSIEGHLQKAAEEHKTLHECCQKDDVDEAMSMECCSNITKELDLALAEHNALMRKLEIKSAGSEKSDHKHDHEEK